MTRRVVYHALAEAELDKLYEDIAIMAGVNVAGRYIGDLIDFIEKLTTFPERGTIRESKVPGLRIIGYRRSVTMAFFVVGDVVTILGIFGRGRNVTLELIEERH